MQNKARKSCERPAENKIFIRSLPFTHHFPRLALSDILIFQEIIGTILLTIRNIDDILWYFYDKQGDNAVAPIESLSLSTFSFRK